ncbi:MAG: hypothetical protein DDT25_01137 [Chloroflexi bacterium]|nr:hypothetical protein [Chloroflexota bacterium]
MLDSQGDTGIEIRLHPHQGIDHLFIAHRHPDAPAGHVVALGEGVEFNPDVPGPRRLQEAHRTVTVESHLGIRGVVADSQVMLPGEGNRSLEEIEIRHCGGRIVGIIQPQNPGISSDI